MDSLKIYKSQFHAHEQNLKSQQREITLMPNLTMS